jgi:hypothetical protein
MEMIFDEELAEMDNDADLLFFPVNGVIYEEINEQGGVVSLKYFSIQQLQLKMRNNFPHLFSSNFKTWKSESSLPILPVSEYLIQKSGKVNSVNT